MTKLEKVQEEALYRSCGKPGYGYFMDMGLGKTLTALTEAIDLSRTRTIVRLVVICPNSFKGGWAAEAKKHELPLDVHVYESGWSRNKWFVSQKGYKHLPVLVINYEAIRTESGRECIFEFVKDKPAMIVADESIQIKGHKSIQTKMAIMLSKQFKFKRLLCGKPMTQGPHDIWAQFRFIGLYDNYNFYAFRNRYCRMGGYMAKQVLGAKNEEELAETINEHAFVAKKSEWGFTIPKVYTTRDYTLTREQRVMFETMYQEFVAFIKADKYVAVEIALTKYIKLAQIQSGFIIDDEGKVTEIVPPDRNPRIQLLKDLMESEISGKVCIVYRHRYSLGMLRAALADYHPAAITGGMTPEEITEEKRRFNEDSSCRVIFLQQQASKYGHTLVGQPEPEDHCSTMIFFETGYSLDDRYQIEDRIHRYGQKGESCLYIDMSGTILDGKIVAALQRKESVYQSIMAATGTTVAAAVDSDALAIQCTHP